MSAYPITLLETDDKLLARIKSGYDQDQRWVLTKKDLQQNALLEDKAAVLPFHINNGLIWFDDRQNNRTRLCVPCIKSVVNEIFKTAHDEAGHQGFS